MRRSCATTPTATRPCRRWSSTAIGLVNPSPNELLALLAERAPHLLPAPELRLSPAGHQYRRIPNRGTVDCMTEAQRSDEDGAPVNDPRLAGTEIADSVIDLIGNTPLVRMKRVSEDQGIECVLAHEGRDHQPRRVGQGPARAGDDPRRRTRRVCSHPGGTIVEPTSGNTGVGLAIVAAQRGYRCVFVMTDKVAPEKVSLLKAYGAEVVVCPVAVEPDDPQSYYIGRRAPHQRAERLPTQPVRQPAQPRVARADDGPRAVAPDRTVGSPTSSPVPARAGRSPASPAISSR